MCSFGGALGLFLGAAFLAQLRLEFGQLPALAFKLLGNICQPVPGGVFGVALGGKLLLQQSDLITPALKVALCLLQLTRCIVLAAVGRLQLLFQRIGRAPLLAQLSLDLLRPVVGRALGLDRSCKVLFEGFDCAALAVEFALRLLERFLVRRTRTLESRQLFAERLARVLLLLELDLSELRLAVGSILRKLGLALAFLLGGLGLAFKVDLDELRFALGGLFRGPVVLAR